MFEQQSRRGVDALLGPLVEALPEGVFVLDLEARIVAANAGARVIVPSARLHQPLSRSLRSPDVLDALDRVIAGGAVERVLYVERLPVERWFDVQVTPLRVEGFELAAIMSLRDLTESRRVERMRVDFVANASHELRTPLASLLGFVETLQGPARDDERAREKFLAIMREQAQRMARLVDDLLSLSRIEQHLHLRPESQVDFSVLIAHIADTLAPMAEDRNLRLDLDLDHNVVVPGDRDELARVVENLIENAIKYGAPEGGAAAPVVVSLHSVGDYAVFTVSDHGPGIASEHLPRLTERFYRVDAGKSRAKGGTGLGLAIVKHIVLRHRGKMHIESELGAGATFRVHLPAI